MRQIYVFFSNNRNLFLQEKSISGLFHKNLWRKVDEQVLLKIISFIKSDSNFLNTFSDDKGDYLFHLYRFVKVCEKENFIQNL